MDTMSVQKLYQQYIKPLNPAERLSLTAIIIQDLAATMPKEAEAPRQRSLLELEAWGRKFGRVLMRKSMSTNYARNGIILH
jgi:hypothetical protein